MTRLQLDEIRTDGGTQVRTATNMTVAESYRDLMADGATFPPIVVFWDGADHWLADGYHRLIARRAANFDAIDADIREGTQRDAILYAVGANATHGIPRSNEDKRNAVRTLLKDPEWSQWSDREIARRCGVGPPLVASVRASLPVTVISYSDRTYTTKHGTVATMKTRAIGAKPDPAPDDDEPDDDEPDDEPDPQLDLEDAIAAATGQPAGVRPPHLPPVHAMRAAATAMLGIEDLRTKLRTSPAAAAAALNGNLETHAQTVGVVRDWLSSFLEGLRNEMSRRQRHDAAD
jgi:hypothetical protein